ncbi:MAG: hypothetical protein LBS30_03925 [Planctomycetota bacterium]|jgi:hypothetical protein|nr:hypothetical protein [Planctomycetota bacterium]
MWDNETTFSDRQTLADGLSDNIVDAGPDDIGLGEPVYLQLSLGAGAAGDLAVTVESSDAPDMTGAVNLVRYQVGAAAVARGGVVLAAPLPTGCGRYLRLRYSGAGGGTVTAGLVQGAQTAGMR